jgi:ATP-dependent HslUV protease ATP-binding subunit HslU
VSSIARQHKSGSGAAPSCALLADLLGGLAAAVDAAYVDAHLGDLLQDEDLSRYIL